MCAMFNSSHKLDEKTAAKLKKRLLTLVRNNVCATEVCATLGKCQRSMCDKCQAGGKSLNQCKKDRKCGAKSKRFYPCIKRHSKHYSKLLFAEVRGRAIYHYSYSNRHAMNFQQLDQRTLKNPGGKRHFKREGTKGKVQVRIKDVTMQVVASKASYTLVKFQINDAEAIHYDHGQKKRVKMSRMLRRPFFTRLSSAGILSKIYHSSRDVGSTVILKAELATMISHTVPDREELLQSYETEREDHELGTHLLQTTVHEAAKGCKIHRSTVKYATANVKGSIKEMKFEHEGTDLMTICAGRLITSSKKRKKKTRRMSRRGMLNPTNAATGKHVQNKGLAGTRVKSKQKAHLHYVCTEGVPKLKMTAFDKKCKHRNRWAARRNMKWVGFRKRNHRQRTSHFHKFAVVVRCMRKASCRANLMRRKAGWARDEEVIETDMMQLLKPKPLERLELEQQRAAQVSTNSPAAHKQKLAHAISLLDNEESVHRGKYEGGTNTKGHQMLKSLLQQDTTGGLHYEAAQILRNTHPSLTAKDGTKHKILSSLSDAHHGASQVVRLALIQDSSPHAIDRKKKTTLFYNFAATEHPIKEVRDFFLQQAEGSKPGSDINIAAKSVVSILASRFEKDHPFFLQVKKDVLHRVRKPLKAMTKKAHELRQKRDRKLMKAEREGFDPTLGGVSRHDIQQRLYALSNLGNMAAREDLPELKKHLLSKHKQIRAQAVRSVRGVPGQDVTQLLMHRFVHDKAEEVKKEAMDILLSNRATTPLDWTRSLSQLIDTKQKLSKVFTQAMHGFLSDASNAPVGDDALPFAPKTLQAHAGGLTHEQFQVSSMLVQMQAKAKGLSDGWFTGPHGYKGCTTCKKCIAKEARGEEYENLGSGKCLLDASYFNYGTNKSPDYHYINNCGDACCRNKCSKEDSCGGYSADNNCLIWKSGMQDGKGKVKSGGQQWGGAKCIQKIGAVKKGDVIRGCNCAGEDDRTALPGSKQFFDPVFHRAAAGVGNKNVGAGIYAEVLAEACLPDKTDPNWTAAATAEAGFYANVITSFVKIIALKISALKDNNSGWGWVGPSIIIMDRQIDLAALPGSKINHDGAGKDKKLNSDMTVGGINIDACQNVLPLIVIPTPFGLDGSNDPGNSLFGKGTTKLFKKMGSEKSKSGASGGDCSKDECKLGTWTWEMKFEFRLAAIVKIELGFSVGFAVGVFIEPCSSVTGAGTPFVAGLDPSISGGITVSGGLDVLVAEIKVGIQVNLFELHLPPYVTWWYERPNAITQNGKVIERKYCPTPLITMELQVVWYLLSGKFFITLSAVWGLFETNLYEYYWPKTKSGSGNEGAWLFQGSIPLWFSGACQMNQALTGNNGNLFKCTLRADDVRDLGTLYGGYKQAYPFSWKGAGTDGTCQTNTCGSFSALASPNTFSSTKAVIPEICSGHGKQQVTKFCSGWKQTGDCKADGPRQPGNDQECDTSIEDGWSGYCECGNGEQAMAKGCSKGAFKNCKEACAGVVYSANNFVAQAKQTNPEGKSMAGGWGGQCTCPDGQVYWVGDNYNACGSLACSGGKSGTCHKTGGKWTGNKVTCGTAQAAPAPSTTSSCTRYAPNGKKLEWYEKDSSAVAACQCRPGWHDPQCSTEESYGSVFFKIESGMNFGDLDEEAEELQLKGKEGTKVRGDGDPFCKLTVNGQSMETNRQDDGAPNPNWSGKNNEKWVGGDFVTKGAQVNVQCWDWDRWSGNDNYGTGSFFIDNSNKYNQNGGKSNGITYRVKLYNGESGAKYAGSKYPLVRVFVAVNQKSRVGTLGKLAMETSWMSFGKTDFPKSKNAGKDCMVKAFSGENQKGDLLKTVYLPRCQTRDWTWGSDIEDKISSLQLSDDCEKVKLWDEDNCRRNDSDNRVITKSINKLNWDLNNDICAITVTGKCG